MAGWKPVGAICWRSNSSSGDGDGPEFIQCVDGQEPYIHDVWNFGGDSGTREVHLTALFDVGAGFVSEFATN